MTSALAWKPRNSKEAFFVEELRPLFMPFGNGLDKSQQFRMQLAVVDVERQNPFAVLTDEYELVSFDSHLADHRQTAEVIESV